MTQIDMQALWAPQIPDEAELARRFATFNTQYFQGRLPYAVVRWSSRMRIAGTCDRQRRIITLSRPYHLHFPNDVDDTLKHEMIHLRLPHHDEAFRRVAERVGATMHCKEYPGLHPRARYIYVCPNCETVFHRTRKERLFCGRCSGRRLDPRFMLVLRDSAADQRAIRSIAAKKPSPQRTRKRLRTRLGEFTRRLL